MPTLPKAFLPLCLAALLASLPLSGSLADPAAADDHAARPTAAWTDPTYGGWHSCVIGGGGYLIDTLIAPSDPKRMYLHGDMDGLFRSDDAGNTWRMIHGGMPIKGGHYEFAGFAVNPKNADEIVVASGSPEAPDQSGIFLSGDGGKTWIKTLQAQFMGNGAFRWAGSRIGGRAGKGGLLVTATEGTGVWRSEDGGRMWQSVGLMGVFFTDVHFDRTDPNRIWLCAQAQADWKLAGGEYRSDDGGRTWTKLADIAPFEIVQDPTNARVLYGLGDAGVQRSVDEGATWQDFSDGLPVGPNDHLGAQPFRAIGAGPDFTLVVQNDTKKIFRLDNGQTRWQTITPTFRRDGWRFNFFSPPANDASSIAVSPTDRSHWYLTDEFGIYQSWDSGRTWTPSNRGIEVTVIHALTQDPAEPARVYLGAGDIGFWWSDDAGAALTQTVSAGAGWVGNIKCIDAAPKQSGRIYAVGGEGWKSNRIYVSDDGGKSVSLLPMHGTGLPTEPFACNSIVADPTDSNSVYVTTSTTIGASSGGVYHSVDGGKSWAWAGQGLPLGKTVFQGNIWWGGRELAMGPDGSLLAISANCGSAYRFDRAASTWARINLPPVGGIYAIAADLTTPGRFYVGEIGNDAQPGNTEGGLFRTDDGGATWKKILAGSVHAVAVDRGVPSRIAASTQGGVSVSPDGGATWTLLEPLPNRGSYDSLAFAGNRILAGTGGNGAFWRDLRDRKIAP